MRHVLGVRGEASAPPGRFEQTIHRQERSLGFAHVGPRTRYTVEHDPFQGFMPPRQAAALLQISADELIAQVARGDHEWRDIAGSVFIRPALVTRLQSLTSSGEQSL